MGQQRIRTVDVFTGVPLLDNPVAVISGWWGTDHG